MAEVIGLINDISPSLRLGWIGVLAWAAVQFVWYRRARVLPGEAESLARSWSAGRQFPSVTRPPETDPIDEAPPSYAPEPAIAAEPPVDIHVEADATEKAEVPFEPDELAEFLGAAPRRRSNRRRRTSANTSAGGGVSDFALDVPKVT